MATATATASTYGAALNSGTLEMLIRSCSKRKAIRSADFEAGGHIWALSCRFDDQQLVSVSLELLHTDAAIDVVAMATLWIKSPGDRWRTAEGRSDDIIVLPAWPSLSSMPTCRCWELPLPATLRGLHHLRVYCQVRVLREDTDIPKNADQISMVQPPTISRDLGRLLRIQGEGDTLTKSELSRRHCMLPDVTFIIEQTEIHAHKLVLAMRSPVFAAEFRWHTTKSTVRVHDISAPTFRAMLHFIYTDQLELKCADGGRVAMALDLLVTADWYDIESLRLMCENVLSESMGAGSVMSTLMEVYGRHSCRAVEASCIEYMASDPAVYAAVMATEDYKELKESCCSFVLEVAEKVAALNMVHNMCSSAPSPSSSRPQMDAPTHYSLEVVEGTHEFKIPCFLFLQRRHGVGKEISSEPFQVGGYNWKIKVYPSSSSEKAQGHISVYAELLTDPGTEGVNVTLGFKLDDQSGQSRHLIKCLEKTFRTKSDWGFAKFVTFESAKSWHLARDASLTIRCDIAITKRVYTSTTTVGTRATMPPSDIASHLKKLLVSEHMSDISFLVEGCELRAHSLLIATRSPTLCEMMMMGNKDDHVIPVDGMTVAAFKAVLHFIYTDELAPIHHLAHNDADQDEVMLAEDMLIAACWFGLDRMRSMCENLLAGFVDSKEDALRTLELNKLGCDLQCSKLINHCHQFIMLTRLRKIYGENMSLFDQFGIY